MQEEFDFIILGAGSAGCVIANRLSADPANRVCLVEAGPADRNPLIHVPLGVMRLIHNPKINWLFETTPQDKLADRKIPVPRGKVLGGSSSINGMVYTRGHPTDYDDWEALGCAGWSFRHVLPYFCRSENNEDFRSSRYHGTGGELNVTYLDSYNPLVEVLFEAAQSLQYKLCDDFCGADHHGFGRRQVTMRGGRRESAATAFLKPAMKRSNLAVLTGALTRRIVFEGRRATGVEIERGGEVIVLRARREVILSAGVFGSPQILMLSGVGAADELKAHGIDVVHHLPEVGKNLQEHISAPVSYSSPTSVPYGLSVRTLPWLAWNVILYGVARKGLFANNILHAGGFIKTDPSLARPDVQLILIPAHRDASGRVGWGFGYALIAIVLRPKSRGAVKLADANPRSAPLINPNFFDNRADLDLLVRGLKDGRRILQAPAFDRYRGKELAPGEAAQTDREIERYAIENAVTVFHPVGSCRMGADGGAVVGPDLKVSGLEALRIADASIMPTLIGGNTNAPAIMIGEKASDMILGKPALPLASV